MNVAHEELEGTPILQLRVIEAPHSDHYPGECIGYLCPFCLAEDETLSQVYHEADCRLAGEHGRNHYPEGFEKPMQTRRTPELDSRHPINIIRMGQTVGGSHGLHQGEVLGWECAECGNSDERIGEIVHDESCPLAGYRGPKDVEWVSDPPPQLAGD